MIRFGICASVAHSARINSQGWHFIEEIVTRALDGKTIDDSSWSGPALVAGSVLPVAAANGLVPADLKIVGPGADPAALAGYMERVLRRAGRLGIRTLVFGSGGARGVPEGFDRSAARDQILRFLDTSGDLAARHGVTLVIEPLNRKECNIINSVAEAMEYVTAVDHPNVRCLLDTYHLWVENEPDDHVRSAVSAIRHVHVADKVGRVAPGLSGQADYRPLFGILKRAGYEGMISVEASSFDVPATGRQVLEFLKRQWDEA